MGAHVASRDTKAMMAPTGHDMVMTRVVLILGLPFSGPVIYNLLLRFGTKIRIGIGGIESLAAKIWNLIRFGLGLRFGMYIRFGTERLATSTYGIDQIRDREPCDSDFGCG